jgi:transglutaminase-like putative cysteine protease
VIYRVRHVTSYDYETPVVLSAHLAHLLPRALPCQRVLSSRLVAEPAASWRRDGTDHFGNTVTWLFLDVAHPAFEVTAEAMVDVGFPDPPAAEVTLPWEEVGAIARRGGPPAWQAAEFLFDSPLAPADTAAADYAASSFPPGRPVLAGLLELNTRIYREFTFRSGVTTTATTIREVLTRRQGVCQDFAHLMISALRGLGLPARYVSGYIRTRPPAASAGWAPTSRMPGSAAGWGRSMVGWTSTRPTTWWCRKSTWCSAGAATSAM